MIGHDLLNATMLSMASTRIYIRVREDHMDIIIKTYFSNRIYQIKAQMVTI
jgi:hypothetical protein